MSLNQCLSEAEIISQNGAVIRNYDGSISVFTVNQVTGMLEPKFMTKPCCEALNIENSFFDVDTQKCMWSSDGSSCIDNNLRIVLNPTGNDGSILSVDDDETTYLNISFDYLFKFNCEILSRLASGLENSSCDRVIDIFETLSANLVLTYVDSVDYNQINVPVFTTPLFTEIGNGNLYNYLVSIGDKSGFYLCGSENNSVDACNNVDIFNVSNETTNCIVAVGQLVEDLFNESGLSLSEFRNSINSSCFGPNWKLFSVDITDQSIINLIKNKKIKFSIELNNICVDTCFLIDNVELNKIATKVEKTDLFISKSPSFDLDRIIDNKKSWITTDTRKRQEFYIDNINNNDRIRDTNYFLDDSRQIINTKEIDLNIDIANAIEADTWNYIINNPCLLTGETIGTTTCTKMASMIVEIGQVVTAVTSTTIVVTSTTDTYSCAAGFTLTPDDEGCIKITTTAATFNGSGSPILPGDNVATYGSSGTFFYPDIQNDTALPVRYVGLFNNLVNQTGGTISPVAINNDPPFWGNPSFLTTNGRLNNIGLSATTGQWLGFTYCIDIPVSGTYYIGLGADNYCRFSINGTLIADFNNIAEDNFRNWSVFPIHMEAGQNIVEMSGLNFSSVTPSNLVSFGAEIYNPASFSDLLNATNPSEANVIFTTGDLVGQNWEIGDSAGYSCPSGYVLDGCGETYVCTKIEREPLITSTTISYSSYTITGISYTTASTSGVICDLKEYCCSEYCGDENIAIDNLLKTPISAYTTLEDFRYYIESELIDTKNRKIISGYPTLKLLYNRYLNSLSYCGIDSSKFNYENIEAFSNLIGNYWVDLIEQVVPATTIWGATNVYRNNIFDNQKYQYKSYSTLFGNNKYSGITLSSPATGYSCDAEVITTIVYGEQTGTSQYYTSLNNNYFGQLYTVQMNSGSEFIGNVNIIGSNGGTIDGNSDEFVEVLSECTLRVVLNVNRPDGIMNNGSISANVYGANGRLTYLWNNGSTTKTIDNIGVGEYSVIVTDTSINGCSVTVSVFVDSNN